MHYHAKSKNEITHHRQKTFCQSLPAISVYTCCLQVFDHKCYQPASFMFFRYFSGQLLTKPIFKRFQFSRHLRTKFTAKLFAKTREKANLSRNIFVTITDRFAFRARVRLELPTKFPELNGDCL